MEGVGGSPECHTLNSLVGYAVAVVFSCMNLISGIQCGFCGLGSDVVNVIP